MTTAKKPKNSMLATLSKLTNDVSKKETPPIIQEVAKPEPVKKIGRKSHTLEGVEYTRLGVKIPVALKKEMIVAMATTHAEYKTMDVFIAEAMKVFLSINR